MYDSLKSYLDTNSVNLVAVSKTKPLSAIHRLYDKGHRLFGENRVQELVEKYENLPKDISWHMIGGLQRNKVKYIAPFITLIHSVDTLALAKTISKEAKKHNRIIPILLQLKVAQEKSKSGFSFKQLQDEILALKNLENILISGIMGMGTFTADAAITRLEFKELKRIFDELKSSHFEEDRAFVHLSMGMSGDYQLAVEEGTTMVRIGSLLFGARN